MKKKYCFIGIVLHCNFSSNLAIYFWYIRCWSCSTSLTSVCWNDLYNDVTQMYNKNFASMIKEFPFRISFVFEQTVDTGGGYTDLYSAFWNIAYVKHFDREKLLVPAVNPNTDLKILPLLGKILVWCVTFCQYMFGFSGGDSCNTPWTKYGAQ